MNKFVNYVINFFAAFIAILLTAIFILMWQTSSIIFNLGGLPKVIENNLSNHVPGLQLKIDDINFSIGKIQAPFGIKANEIEVNFKGEDFNIEQASVYFSPFNILLGDFKFDRIILDGLNFEISQNPDKNGDFFQTNRVVLPKFFQEVFFNSNKLNYKNSIAYNFKNAEYSVTNSSIDLVDFEQIDSINNINFQITKVDNDFNISGQFKFNTIKEKIKFSMIRRKDGESDINFEFQNINNKEVDNFFVSSIDNLNFIIGGEINLKITSNNKISHFNSSLKVSKIDYPSEYSELSNFYSKVQSGMFDLTYSFEEDQLKVQNFLLLGRELTIASGSANISNFRGSSKSLKIDFKSDEINSKFIPKNLLRKYGLHSTNGNLSNINLKADILINRDNFNFSVKSYKLSGFLNNFQVLKNDINNKIIKTLMNGSFELNNNNEMETNLKLDLVLNNLSPELIIEDIIPKSYNINLEDGSFENLSLKGNIIINNDNLNFIYKDFEVGGVLNNLKVSSKNKKNFLETVINLKFLANLENESIKNFKAKALFSDFKFFREGMYKEFFFDKSKFDLTFEDNKVQILNFQSNLSANSVFEGYASLNLSDKKEISKIDIHLKMDKFNYEWLTSIWPNDFGVKTRNWIKTNVKNGFGENCNLSLVLNLDKNKIVQSLFLNWKHKNSKIKFYKDLPYAYLPEANINITKDKMIVSFLNSEIGNINVDKGELNISPIFTRNARAKVNLTGKSELNTILNFLNEKDLDLISKYKIGPASAGNISYKSNFEWPVKKNIRKNEFEWTIDASGENLNIPSLPFNLTHEISKFQIKANNNKFRFSSIGKINNIQSKLSITKDGVTNPEIKLDFDDSEELAILISKFSQIKLYGKAKGFLEIKNFDFKNFNSKVVIDLNNATVEIPYINYIKEKGLNGLISTDLTFIDGKLRRFSNIQGEIGSVAFDGNVKINNGSIDVANFNYITFPGTLINKFNLTQNKKEHYKIDINAEKINLMEYLKFYSRTKKEPKKNKYIFNITSEKFIFPGGIEANGLIEGHKNFDDSVKVKLLGDIKINENIKVKDTMLIASQTDSEIILDGNGYINSEPVKILMQDGKEDNSKILTLKGNDAGKILNGLNITKLVEGGTLKISVFLKEEDYKNYEALIDVSKFNVTNAPILVQLISTLSLTGLLNLLEENGIYFERGYAKINNLDNKFNIQNIEAVGEAMAITLKGWINNKKETLQIQGTIAPATLLTKLLEPIPVLNDLLIGGDKAGVVLTEFRLDGSTEKPSISFRPLSSAPGLLRDIFNLFRSDQVNQTKIKTQN
ncbi:MAG: hypothetical protein CMN37_04495 [SAR116 cluster bacterium]|nr:hypothetical protein [SAR116 cluster bacterium]